MPEDVVRLALEAKGFLSEEEGLRLYRLAAEASTRAPCLEVGSYCGKSALFLAAGCRAGERHPLFTVDHHRGSEEQQVGQLYFDSELFDSELGSVYTLDRFMRNVIRAGLADWVIPVVTTSARLAAYCSGLELGLVFIDGGHGEEDVRRDFRDWSPRLVRGGYLCMHDLYADPSEGGQAPYQTFQRARASEGWEYVGQWGSLGVLRRG